MGLLDRIRKQTAVWWPNTGTDRYGNKTYGDPVEIKCRWEDHYGQFFDARGNTANSKAVVYVDREMKVGDILWRGELDSNTPADPEADEDALEIIAFDSIPARKPKPKTTLYRAFL